MTDLSNSLKDEPLSIIDLLRKTQQRQGSPKNEQNTAGNEKQEQVSGIAQTAKLAAISHLGMRETSNARRRSLLLRHELKQTSFLQQVSPGSLLPAD
jgi:hypothetical protein